MDPSVLFYINCFAPILKMKRPLKHLFARLAVLDVRILFTCPFLRAVFNQVSN